MTALERKLRRIQHTCNFMCVIERDYEEHVDERARFVDVSLCERLIARVTS